ncbi:MAG: electron transfer flavoprotein subunit beta/FixA family protein [Desulfosarcinaceae bacterium]
MNILVCVKRVPDIGSRIDLSEDRQAILTKNLGFTISPHEECAVEAAIQLVEAHGGQSTVVTLGPAAAEEQLRDSLARGADRGILIETDGSEWDPAQTAAALAAVIRAENENAPLDLILFGNESADSGGCQVGIRVAHALDLPCLAGAKRLEISAGGVSAWREVDSGWEIFDFALPAVVAVKEGINLPRYPSLRGTMKAKKKPVDRVTPEKTAAGLQMQHLFHPPEMKKEVEMLGQGPQAASRIVEVLKALEVI